MKRIFYPGSTAYERSYDCVVSTASELTTDPELIALDIFSRALVLNTDQGADAAVDIRIKIANDNWKVVC